MITPVFFASFTPLLSFAVKRLYRKGRTGLKRLNGLNAVTSGTNRPFSIYGGTTGQSLLNIMYTTIKCPTKLSHFRDQWDKNGSECKLQLVLKAEHRQAKACTLNPLMDKLEPLPIRLIPSNRIDHNSQPPSRLRMPKIKKRL
jgi:hypothetical protein